MPGLFTRQNLRFLFREDQGVIDRRTWWLAVTLLGAVWIIAALIATALRYAIVSAVMRLDNSTNMLELMQKMTFSGIFNIVMILVYVCYYFVSAKRFRDLGRSPYLGLILPAAIYLAASFGPVLNAFFPPYGSWLAGVCLSLVAFWNVVVLGFTKGELN
ncbi:DUF805 domain-containing protein [Methylovirgula sp. 4M-Z18]|uniref:DUF805 domain-containing protein n=1 Tax=Methylovirgula sp. 4M-Z18 TaxID=2293567 RepID=UPI000E2F4BC4|nr:hypothetical protein [Methylovirgula sp. 4M-Z18]RFB79535.1 hypothetical protein DYH55_08535 [Methylovirgula sp. 4M-Z18]